MGSLVRGGLGGGCKGRRDSWGNRVIFIDDNMQTIILIILRDRRRERRRRRRCQNGTKISSNLRIKRNLGIMLFVVKSRRKKWRGGIEIGRDAAAFFSDLNFRFLLMHYISYTNTKLKRQRNYRNSNKKKTIEQPKEAEGKGEKKQKTVESAFLFAFRCVLWWLLVGEMKRFGSRSSFSRSGGGKGEMGHEGHW